MEAQTVQPRGLISRLIGLVIKLVLLLVVVGAVAWIASRPSTPDAFFNQALPQDARAGTLLRSEPFTKAVPSGAQGWLILYVTARAGKPAVASAVVVVSLQGTPMPRPVIAWAHGTTGVVSGCAPSVMEKPFDNLPDIGAMVREGWAYVGTDYPGLGTDGGHTYLVGEDAAHAVLDAVRAARQLKGANLDDRIVVWGHSQGGNSALWAGILATELAPEIKLLGVAALAPASDLKGLVSASKGGMFGKIVSAYLMRGYAQAYADVKADDYVKGVSRIVANDIGTRCVGGYGTLFSVLETKLLPAEGIFSQDPTGGPLGKRLADNTPTRIIPAPVLIAQGEVAITCRWWRRTRRSLRNSSRGRGPGSKVRRRKATANRSFLPNKCHWRSTGDPELPPSSRLNPSIAEADDAPLAGCGRADHRGEFTGAPARQPSAGVG